MPIDTTRRGFLKGSVGAAVLTGCSHEKLNTEAVESPLGPEATDVVRVTTEVNGKSHTLDVHPDQSALSMVRTRLKLTGSKHGCGHGACGACTMRVDGNAVATCLLPATSLEGRVVETVESIGTPGKLHPVQRAFMAEDGMQCGYCTPGFMVEAATFHDQWRAEHGKKMPSRDQVAAAMAGHLCRCAAYDAIYRAVQGACAGKFDKADPIPPRYDATEKVTGEAQYTVDVQLQGQLVGVALYSPYAHARVKKLDWSRALKVPGVRGAVDLLGRKRLVRFACQEIMGLAAVDEHTARRALELVDIEYEQLPPLLNIEAARAPGAAPVYTGRKERKHPENASEGPLIPEKWKGNIRGPLWLFSKKGRKAERAVEAARAAGTLSEGKFTTQVQCHTPLEPHAAVAKWESADKLTVYMSTQGVTHMARDIAERWRLRRENVRVLSRYVGGGFGGKGTLTTEVAIAVELARVCQAPVLYALDRRAEIMIGGNRPETRTEFALATDSAGEMTGMKATTYSNSGVAVGHVCSVMFRIIYPKAPRRIIDYDVTTHGPPGKPFRGPGGPQAFFASEQIVDEVAHRRGEDPLEVRRRWDPNPARKPLYKWASSLPVWRDRPKHAADKGRFRRGVGLAFGAWFAFAEPKTRIQLDASPAGLVASSASQDIGNGSRTTIADTIGREMGIPAHKIGVHVGDSNYLHGPQSAGSRSTSSIVPPCLDACRQLKEELVDIASRHYRLRGATVGKTGVDHSKGSIAWSDVIGITPPITVVGRRKRDKGGYFLPPIQGLAVEKYISSSIALVELVVDTRLGRVDVLETWGGFAIGEIISPVLARSQAAGGILQGISYALYEERRLDPRDGFLLTGGLEDYRISGIGDTPKINIHFEQHGYEKVRGHAVGLGEIVTLGPPAAVANAVFNATGWRPYDLPLRPDRVLQGVRA